MSTQPPHAPSTLLRYNDPVRREVAEAQGVLLQVDKVELRPQIAQRHQVLHRLLPPRDLGDGWVQTVSNAVPTRQDVRELTHLFEYRLKNSKARMTGICEVRSVIYAMLFEELIRQVTVDCAERGLLLLRIRDELRMSSDAYRTLYEASVHLGRHKTVEAERGMSEMTAKIKALREEKESLSKDVKRLQAKLKAMERCCHEQQQADHKKHAEEISFLTFSVRRLEEQEQTIRRIQAEEKRQIA